MLKRIYQIENLDCAGCAAKIEQLFRDHPQVEEAVIVFETKQLHLTAADPDTLLPELTELARKIEGEVSFYALASDHAGHHHAHSHQSGEGKGILIGAALFAAGLLLQRLLPGIPAYLPVYLGAWLLLGWEVLSKALDNLAKGQLLDENFLMSLATVGAFFIGEYPEAVGIMLFYRAGEYFEHRAVDKSRAQIMEAVDLRPETVTLVSGATIPAGQAAVGDLLLVRPGDRIPLDGVVTAGESHVDTKPITGEPVPVTVRPGDRVISGCVNVGGLLTVRVEKVLSESMVSRILSSVEHAAASKPKMDRFITRFSRVYTPIVVALAAATAVIPSLIWGNWSYWIYTALSFLVMSCPCALVLSVPLAFFAGIGAGSKKGILFKGGQTIEALAGVKAVLLDKTGTVTKGDFSVKTTTFGEEVLRLCASAEQYSSHPVAASILSFAREKGISLAEPQDLEEVAGHGIRATVEDRQILCGNGKLMQRFSVSVPKEETAAGSTRILMAVDGRYAGYLEIADTVKPGAGAVVSALKGRGIATAMLTGDEEVSARAVAEGLGITRVYARLLPEEKLHTLQQLRKDHGPVLYVGDGINDAPVLSGADVGAAMGSGADAAIEAADVVFMTSDPEAIPEAITISRRAKAAAWQNVIFALGVKGLVVLLGLMGHGSMWAAVFADSGVALLCVLNSLRCLYRPGKI